MKSPKSNTTVVVPSDDAPAERVPAVSEPNPPSRTGLIRKMIDDVEHWVHEVSHEIHSLVTWPAPAAPPASPAEPELTAVPEAPRVDPTSV